MANLERAIEIAVQGHKGQLQKNGLPYILHPLTLMFKVATDEQKMVAVLHDVVEDTAWTDEDLVAEGFSASVLEAVRALTHDAAVPYEAYITEIAKNDLARVVKMADLQHNMDVLRIHDLKDRDLEHLKKYHAAWFRLKSLA